MEDIYERYVALTQKYKPLSTDQELAFFMKAKKGNKFARETLINHNLNLVIKIAFKLCNNKEDIMDIIQVGNIALIKAIDNFDINMGYKFSTFAYNYIQKTITTEVAHMSCWINFAEYAYWEFFKFQKVHEETELYLNPSLKELMFITGLTKEKILDYMNFILPMLSLDTKAKTGNDEYNNTIADYVPDPNNDIENLENDIAMEEMMNIIFSNIDERSALFIKMHYGLDKFNSYTLLEIGNTFGLTKERVRQIIDKPIKKLREDQQLKEFALLVLAD